MLRIAALAPMAARWLQRLPQRVLLLVACVSVSSSASDGVAEAPPDLSSGPGSVRPVVDDIRCGLCGFMIEDTWSAVVGAAATRGSAAFKGGGRESQDYLDELCTIPSEMLQRYLALYSIRACPAAADVAEGEESPCTREGQRWFIERDAPWTADSTAHYDELSTLRLKELQLRARNANVSAELIEHALDNDDPTNDDEQSRENLIALLMEAEPDPFLEESDESAPVHGFLKEGSGAATKYEEAVLERLMDESRHWQLKAYVTMCTEEITPRDDEISDMVRWQVTHMEEYTEKVFSPAKYDATQSAWEMIRDGRDELAAAACKEMCEEEEEGDGGRGKKKQEKKKKKEKKGKKKSATQKKTKAGDKSELRRV